MSGCEASRVTGGSRQNPTEALFAFICSANNNLARITLTQDRIRAQFGERLCELPADVAAVSSGASMQVPSHIAEFNNIRAVHRFPTIKALASASEEDLRGLGLGYRAPFVVKTAKVLLAQGGEAFLRELSMPTQWDRAGRAAPNRQETELALRTFAGVGPKVAACVALFGLGHHDAVPIDIHVSRVAARTLAPPEMARRLLASRSVTPRLHEDVGNLFRDRFGNYAGWAQTLLFSAERAGLLASKTRVRAS